MNRKQYALLIILAVLAGLVGGAVSSWIFMDEPVFAQKTQQHQKVITAEELRLVDEQGTVRARFGLWKPDGRPILYLTDENGKPRLLLNVWHNIPTLTLQDQNGKQRARLYLSSDGNPRIDLNSEDSLAGASLYVFSNQPNLILKDKKGKVIWKALREPGSAEFLGK